MRAVFLDIDGVVCTELSWRMTELFRRPLEKMWFDPIALWWIRWLVRRTGAEIVLSSSWRDALTVDDPLSKAFVGNLYDAMRRNGTPFFDAAPQLDSGDKGEEIAYWLKGHPCESYVILDDHDCFTRGPSVRGRWVPVPEGKGLRRREAVRALEWLRTPVEEWANP